MLIKCQESLTHNKNITFVGVNYTVEKVKIFAQLKWNLKNNALTE